MWSVTQAEGGAHLMMLASPHKASRVLHARKDMAGVRHLLTSHWP